MRFQAEVDRALEITRKEMIDDPGEVWPRLLAFMEDGAMEWYHIDPNFMADWRTKNTIAALIVKTCYRPNVKVTVFLSDALSANAVVDRDKMPKSLMDWPKDMVRETLIVAVNARGMHGEVMSHCYTRDAENKRVFAAEPEASGWRASGRFIYDLTKEPSAAVRDALMRDRDGVGKADA